MMQQGKPFRKAAQTFLITIPKLEVPPAELVEEYKKREPDLDEISVSKELHADGTPHMHAYMHFKKTINVKDPFRWDFMGKHCNIQTMRRKAEARGYVCKGVDHVSWFESPPPPHMYTPGQGKRKKKDHVNEKAREKEKEKEKGREGDDDDDDKKIVKKRKTKKKKDQRKPLTQIDRTILHFQEGGTVDDMDSELWGFLLMHKPKVEAFQQHFERIIRLEDVSQRRGEVSFMVPSLVTVDGIDERVDRRVSFPVVDERPFKSKQWWIWGDTNVGKSTIRRKLVSELGLSAFIMPKDINFQAWNDRAYHFAYMDEYKGEHNIQFLNEWLEGSHIQLDVKYGHRDKSFNIPTIILSNFPPEKAYPNAQPEEMKAFLGRLEVIHMVDYAHSFQFRSYSIQ